jgi:hypothetical protein
MIGCRSFRFVFFWTPTEVVAATPNNANTAFNQDGMLVAEAATASATIASSIRLAATVGLAETESRNSPSRSAKVIGLFSQYAYQLLPSPMGSLVKNRPVPLS